MHGFVKFPDGFPAARILLEWKDYPQVAQGFIARPTMQPVRSRRGEEVFAEEGGEAGGRDGAVQIVEEVVEATNLAKDMAARILSAPTEEENAETARVAQRSDDRSEQTTPASHAADKAQAGREKTEEQVAGTRAADERRDAQPRGAQVEDQTLIELRDGFAAGRDDDSMDMGI
jgi:hypothetical protein